MKRYKCKAKPLRIAGRTSMFDVVNDYLDEWERDCGGKIYVLTDLFGKRTKIFIEECIDHWYPEEPMEEPLDKDPEEAQDTHSQEDIAYRLSLLPCVREALTELPYEPLKNEKGNWEVQARTPRRRDHQSNRIEVIKIVIAYDPRKGWHLKTYHPYWDTTSKKKPVRSRP